MKGAKTIAFDSSSLPLHRGRWVGPYHVRACALIISIFLSTLWEGCATSTTQQSAESYRALSQSKARTDLLYQGARERVLLASYAEQLNDAPRAARWLQQAWCLDPESTYLAEKIAFYQELSLLPTPPRCFGTPRTRSDAP